MHILPRVLALLLCLPAWAAASPFDRFPGEWGGTVASDDGCEWKVRASVKGGQKSFTGTFTYEGECAEGLRRGSFTIKPKGETCYVASVSAAGMPPMTVNGCAEDEGTVTFQAPGFDGTLTFHGGGNAFTLAVKAGPGSAEGEFRRLKPKKNKRAARSGPKPQGRKSEQKATPEVLIGGY